jgi:hypothetical protein
MALQDALDVKTQAARERKEELDIIKAEEAAAAAEVDTH